MSTMPVQRTIQKILDMLHLHRQQENCYPNQEIIEARLSGALCAYNGVFNYVVSTQSPELFNEEQQAKLRVITARQRIKRNKHLAPCRDTDGLLYSHQAGYPIFYLDTENSTLCATCANEQEAYNKQKDAVTSVFIENYGPNWENGNLFCDGCNNRIPSAYAEPDEEENQN